MKKPIVIAVVGLLAAASVILWYSAFTLVKATYLSYVSFPKPIDNVKKDIDSDKLLSLINSWRKSQGFAEYIKDNRLCEIAKDRADDTVCRRAECVHDGFVQKYSNYSFVIAENITGAYSEQDALDRWLSSKPHRNTLEKSYKYSCVACKGQLCVQIFSSFKTDRDNPY